MRVTQTILTFSRLCYRVRVSCTTYSACCFSRGPLVDSPEGPVRMSSAESTKQKYQVHARLSGRDHERLRVFARDNEESLATILRRAIRKFLDEQTTRPDRQS